jgi:hypothetical protein
MKKHLILILLLLLLISSTVIAKDLKITFGWKPNPEPELRGYKLHHGNKSKDYSDIIDVGNVTRYTVIVQEGIHYYALTAYGEGILDSDYSDEVAVLPIAPPQDFRITEIIK